MEVHFAGRVSGFPLGALQQVAVEGGGEGEAGGQAGRDRSAARFVESYDDVAAAVVREFHRLHHHVGGVDLDQRLGPRRGRAQGQVQRVTPGDRLLDPGAGEQRVAEAVPAAVGLWVGAVRGAEQGEPYGRGGAAVLPGVRRTS